MAKFTQVILPPTLRANQPAATDTPPGALIYISDESVTERVSNDGLTWESYTDTGGAGSGTVTNTGTLTADLPVVGNGGVDVKILAAGTALQVLRMNAGATAVEFATIAGTGDVVGPASATDNAITRFDSTTGKLIQNSTVTVSDTGDINAGTSAVLTTGTVELGAASDTTLSRASAGVLAVEGVNVLTTATGQPLDATLTALAAYNTNGLITQTAADTFTGRTVTGTANQISVANGDGVAGNPTLSLPADVLIPTVLTVPNTGLHLLDTNASHDLIIAPGSDLTADHTLTITTGDADRTLTLAGAATISGTNTGDVTLAGTPDYITIAGQVITRNAVDLAADVTGALPIANGGTANTTATAAFDALAPTTTKGDVIVHNGTDNIRVGVGANGTVLTADSAEVSGVKWAAVAGTGDVVGPASSTDNAVARFDGTTGKLIQNSAVTIADTTGLIAGSRFANTGLKLEDTNASHLLTVAPGSDLTADHTLTVTTGDADRTLTLTGDASITGTNTGDQTITLTGDVTGSGTGSFATTIANDAVTTAKILNSNVTLAKIANAAANSRWVGSGSGGTGAAYTENTFGVGLTVGASSVALSTAAITKAIGLTIDGGGSAITTGIKADISVPFTCTITGARLLADQSGSIVIDIWKDTYANYPPTDADSITAAAPPTISAATKSEDTTLTGWTTTITAGDTLRFNVDSATTITRVNLTLTVTL